MGTKYKINCNHKKGIESTICKTKKHFCEEKSKEFSSTIKTLIASDSTGAVALSIYELTKPYIKKQICR